MKDTISKKLDSLTDEQQNIVWNFIENIIHKPKSFANLGALSSIAGAWSNEEALEISRIIREGCESVDESK